MPHVGIRPNAARGFGDGDRSEDRIAGSSSSTAHPTGSPEAPPSYSRTVQGGRADAEAALARLRLDVGGGDIVVATNAAHGSRRCDCTCANRARSGLTVRTDRSACNRTVRLRVCRVVGAAGDLPLSKARSGKTRADLRVAGRTTITARGCARYASTVSKVLEHAKRVWLDHLEPGPGCPPPTGSWSPHPDVPEAAEVRAAMARSQGTRLPLYAYVLGLATIGCRRRRAAGAGGCKISISLDEW